MRPMDEPCSVFTASPSGCSWCRFGRLEHDRECCPDCLGWWPEDGRCGTCGGDGSVLIDHQKEAA